MEFPNGYVCVGAGSLVEDLIAKWALIGSGKPRIIFDSDPNKEGRQIAGIDVVHIEKLGQFICDDEIVIITSSFFDEIINVLKKLDIKNEIVNYKTADFSIVQKNILQKNIELNNIHSGKRCFIIGNGPSLKKQNLSILRNEITIVVNNFYTSKDLLKLKPDYWMLADPAYWNEPEGRERFLRPILKILNNELIKSTLFLPQDSLKNFIEFNKDVIFDRFRFYYMDIYKDYFTDLTESISSIDFSNKVPPFSQNVLSPSLMLALNLGFKEIYFIGCDHSWWNFSKEDIDKGKKIVPHYYEKSANDVEYSKNIFKSLGYEKIQYTIKRQVLEYGKINEYAKKKGIKIYNATEGGFLEVFDRIEYNSLFDFNQKEGN